MRKHTDSPMWNAGLNQKMWELYLRDGDHGMLQYAAPLLAHDFSNLPPAYVEAEEFDCLHDEGIAYAKALEEAGVEVQIEDVNGTFHGFDFFTGQGIAEEKSMNVRKPTDYSALFAALNTLMAAELPQMELYREIGRLVCGMPEKGAAVASAEYLHSAYPNSSGFSPRNLRRMRDFYRTYANSPEVLAEAMSIGWTQNVVILEAELTLQDKL